MKRCKCGSMKFYASINEWSDWTVDENGSPAVRVESDDPGMLSEPVNYSCIECGEVYDTWDEIPEA